MFVAADARVARLRLLNNVCATSEVTNARYRSHCPEQTLHVRRDGDADRHLRRDGGAQDPNRHLSEHWHSRRRRRWTYDGLPADDMSKRVIYYYERTLSSQVNDIEHIESQSLPRYGAGQGLLSARRQYQRRAGRDDRSLSDRPQISAAGNHPAFRAELQRLERARHSAGAVEQVASQAELFDAGQNFIRPQLAQIAGSAIPSPYGGKVLQVQVDLDQDKLQAYGLSAEDVVDAIGRQNIITPVGTEKVGDPRICRWRSMAPRHASTSSTTCRSASLTGPRLHSRRRLRPCGRPPQINMVRVDGANAVPDDDTKVRARLPRSTSSTG